jgi:hypothetical protein
MGGLTSRDLRFACCRGSSAGGQKKLHAYGGRPVMAAPPQIVVAFRARHESFRVAPLRRIPSDRWSVVVGDFRVVASGP